MSRTAPHPHLFDAAARPRAMAIALALLLTVGMAARVHAAPALATAAVQNRANAGPVAVDGVVEAVRRTVVAAQVPGNVLSVLVKAGDKVAAGQVLLRLDARAAEQQAGAAAAQVQAAQAAREAATREFERQKQLFQKNYISQAALDRAESQFKAATAQASAQGASAEAARTESGFYVLKAPYAGVVADVAVVQGDMALPGRPLLTLHDPSALRVTAAVPQTAQPQPGAALQVELPGGLSPQTARINPTAWQLLPAVDAATHTLALRLDLPAGTGAVPGQFARVWLPASADSVAGLSIPAQAVVRRAELSAVYVVGADGKPLLRQVRLGARQGDRVEVLTGLNAGERVALEPQAAAKVQP